MKHLQENEEPEKSGLHCNREGGKSSESSAEGGGDDPKSRYGWTPGGLS